MEYRMIMWQLIDALEDVKPDYLQIFKFYTGHNDDGTKAQIIAHIQENPDYRAVYYFPLIGDGIQEKVYCIDDGDHVTMLFAEEY